ncbi:MAG: DUF445 domain-containing protein [Pseudomonadota bacterium]
MQPPSYNIAEREARLAGMKRVALSLLLAMLALYVVTGLYEAMYPWLSYVRAFAEAATVGALADWFAVTALFRHPMGIPIPHTAIVQQRKDELGATLARFVAENFLVIDALRPRLEAIRFADAFAKWVSQEQNARRLADDIAGVLSQVLTLSDNRSLRNGVKAGLRDFISGLRLSPLFGQLLEFVLLKDPDQTLVNQLITLARDQLYDNQDKLRESLSERTPWWIPGFVDRRIVERIVNELDEFLTESEDENEDETKARLVEMLERMIEALKTDEHLIERGEELKEKLLERPELMRYVSRAVNELGAYLDNSLADPESAMRQRLNGAMQGMGERLLADETLCNDVDKSCRETLLYIVDHHRASISSIISETIRHWDADATAKRIELAVGRDLQFIRINGTVVGGMVGLVLHTIWQLMQAGAH